MDLDKKILDQLVELMQRDGLDRIRVRVNGMDLDVRMSLERTGGVTMAPARGATAAELAAVAVPKPDELPANVRTVLAPLVGVFYRAPGPGAKPFVEIGDAVAAGQVLCILEAMKLMNEIVSEHDGKIVKVLAKDGELVALHQPLFWIEV